MSRSAGGICEGTSQNPAERKLCRGAVLGRGMRLQLLDQCKVAAQIIALKPRHVAPCVARPQRRDIRDLAGQETAAERAVGDKANAKLLTERQDLGFDVAGPQRNTRSARRLTGGWRGPAGSSLRRLRIGRDGAPYLGTRGRSWPRPCPRSARSDRHDGCKVEFRRGSISVLNHSSSFFSGAGSGPGGQNHGRLRRARD
jgi:hypothetical protein